MKILVKFKTGESVFSYIERSDLKNPETTVQHSDEDAEILVDSGEYEIVDYIGSYLENEKKEHDERVWRDSKLEPLYKEINKLEDVGLDASSLRAYREALRQYPQNPNFPNCQRPVIEK